MEQLPEKISGAVQEFINKVYALLGTRVKKIILYGSYARGDYNDGSDIDIMVLTDLTDDEIIKYRDYITDIAYDIEEIHKFDIMLSPLVKNIDKFNYWLEALPFYMNIQKEGVVLSECENI